MKPISRSDLIRRLRLSGFHGPYPGKRHSVMIKGTRRVQISNPHQGDIDVSLLKRILAQAGISESEWESVK